MKYRSLFISCVALAVLSSCTQENNKPIEMPDTTAKAPVEPSQPEATPGDAPSSTAEKSEPPAPTKSADTAVAQKPQQQAPEKGIIVQKGKAVEERGNTAPNRFFGMQGTVSKDAPPQLKMATLRKVRTAQHEYFDRITFEFDGEEIPGYHIEAVAKPGAACGSGADVQVEGEAWIEMRLTPVRSHDDKGKPTVAAREYKFAYPVFREVERTCDFEGTITYVIGLASSKKFRLLELKDPIRIVIDVVH